MAKAHMTKYLGSEVLYTFSSPILILLYVGLEHPKASKNVNGNIVCFLISLCHWTRPMILRHVLIGKKNIVCQMEICLYAMNFSLKDLTF